MAKNLEELLHDNPKHKEFGFFTKLKRFYNEKIDYLRPYIASLGALSIGIANWSKDFAADSTVGLPFLYTNFAVGGHEWYNLALLQEGLTVGGITATAKNKIKTAKYAILYEIGSAVNSILYYTTLNTRPLGNYYGGIWNSVFYFYQIPTFFMMLKHYFGKTRENIKKEA
jgi:hypothetical protein